MPNFAPPSPRTQLRAIVRAQDTTACAAWWQDHQKNTGLLRKAVQHARQAGWEEAAAQSLQHLASRQALTTRESMEWWMYSEQNPRQTALRNVLKETLPPATTAFYALVYGHDDLVLFAISRGVSPRHTSLVH